MLRRGDIVLCAMSGDYGKPRPAVVIQSDLFNETHASVSVCPLTTYEVDAPLFRVPVTPSEKNGLRASSQLMVDKVTAVKVSKASQVIGCLTQEEQELLNNALLLWFGLT